MIYVVLDTNIIIASLSSHSKYHWVMQKLINQEYSICVTNDILLEYEEKIIEKYSLNTARNFLSFLKEAPNCKLINVFYNWNLILDPDDNKFTDCAFSASANYIVTEDRHFNVLKTLDFPKIEVLGIAEFGSIINL